MTTTASNVLLLRLFLTDLGHLSSPFKLLLQPITCHELLSRSKCWEQKREGDLAGAVIPACSPLSDPCCKKQLCSQATTGIGVTCSSAHRTRFLLLGVGSSTPPLTWHFSLSNTLSLQSSHRFPIHAPSIKQGENAKECHLTLPHGAKAVCSERRRTFYSAMLYLLHRWSKKGKM